MGIYDRDYFRDERRGPAFFRVAGACQWIIAINVTIFVLGLISQDLGDRFFRWFSLFPPAVTTDFQVWRLLTYAFVHSSADVFHILFNMLALWFFGRTIESMLGTREFIVFYCASAIFSGLGVILFAYMVRVFNPVIGASGAVFAVTVLFAMHFPRQQLILYFIPIEARWLVLIFVLTGAIPLLQALSGNPDAMGRVSHSAHLAGALFGFLYFKQSWRLTSWMPAGRRNWKFSSPFRQRPNLRVYEDSEPQPYVPPPQPKPPRPRVVSDEPLEPRVDEVLAKISREGEASLTDEERQILIEASRRYRERRS